MINDPFLVARNQASRKGLDKTIILLLLDFNTETMKHKADTLSNDPAVTCTDKNILDNSY